MSFTEATINYDFHRTTQFSANGLFSQALAVAAHVPAVGWAFLNQNGGTDQLHGLLSSLSWN